MLITLILILIKTIISMLMLSRKVVIKGDDYADNDDGDRSYRLSGCSSCY